MFESVQLFHGHHISGTFAATGDMIMRRASHAAVLLPDRGLLITGGKGQGPTAYEASSSFLGTLATAELYDSSTGTFSATGSMTARRAQHTATTLNDGPVLIAGGFDSAG